MITLITGVPGSGKTAFALNQMLEITKTANRPIFVHGIPGLKLPHETVRCDSTNCDVCHQLPDTLLKANEWQQWAPEGAILFYDETQNIFRPRASAAQVPEHVATLEVHRHRGLDFILITQHPNLIDANVRRLVSRHVHLAGTWARRVSYEWGEAAANVTSTGSAVKGTYIIPKHVFPLYQSATLHTKLNRQRPFLLYLFPIFIFLAVFLGYRIYASRIAPKTQETPNPTEQTGTGTGLQSTTVPTEDPVKKFDFVPIIPNRPESAPAYQHLVKATAFPQLKGCIKSKDRCTCYTQQATEYLVSKFECEDIVKSARFNPYIQNQTTELTHITSGTKRQTTNQQPKQDISMDMINNQPPIQNMTSVEPTEEY